MLTPKVSLTRARQTGLERARRLRRRRHRANAKARRGGRLARRKVNRQLQFLLDVARQTRLSVGGGSRGGRDPRGARANESRGPMQSLLDLHIRQVWRRFSISSLKTWTIMTRGRSVHRCESPPRIDDARTLMCQRSPSWRTGAVRRELERRAMGQQRKRAGGRPPECARLPRVSPHTCSLSHRQKGSLQHGHSHRRGAGSANALLPWQRPLSLAYVGTPRW